LILKHIPILRISIDSCKSRTGSCQSETNGLNSRP